jgi:hypothetical protein
VNIIVSNSGANSFDEHNLLIRLCFKHTG